MRCRGSKAGAITVLVNVSEVNLSYLTTQNTLIFEKFPAEQTNEGQLGRCTDLQHEFAHGFELLSGVVLSMKQRVIGHLPQLHHHITQLTLCGDKEEGNDSRKME